MSIQGPRTLPCPSEVWVVKHFIKTPRSRELKPLGKSAEEGEEKPDAWGCDFAAEKQQWVGRTKAWGRQNPQHQEKTISERRGKAFVAQLGAASV